MLDRMRQLLDHGACRMSGCRDPKARYVTWRGQTYGLCERHAERVEKLFDRQP